MSTFKDIKTTIFEQEGFEPTEIQEIPEFEDAIDSIDDDIDVIEEPACEIFIGSSVSIIELGEDFDPSEHQLDDDEYEELQSKVEDGEKAIVFDELDDDPSKVSIVFENGLEVFSIPKTMLTCHDDEDDDNESNTELEGEPTIDIDEFSEDKGF